MALVSIKSWPLTAVNLLQFCYDKNTKTLPKTNQLRPGNFGNTLHSHRSTMKSLRKIDMWVDSKGLNNHYWTVLNHSTKAGYEKALIFFFTRVKMIWREIIYIICEILQRQRNWTSSKVEDNSGRRLKQNNTIMCKQIKKKKEKVLSNLWQDLNCRQGRWRCALAGLGKDWCIVPFRKLDPSFQLAY